MSNYGVVPTGFHRKPLAVILAEIEAQLITEFGPQVVQTPQSPLGQLNGLMADIITQTWELAEDIYQSYDPEQAEGARLDMLGRIRLITRTAEETDLQLRQALTNQSTARVNIADFLRDLENIEGVSYRQIFVNDTNETDFRALPPHTVAVAVLGGEDEDIGEVVHRHVIPGISTHGNAEVNILDEGFCRSLRIVRPVEVETDLTITVRVTADRQGCPPPAALAIEQAFLAYATALETRPWNGQTITAHYVRSFIEAAYPNVEVLEVTGTKDGEDATEGDGIRFAFYEIANVKTVLVLTV